MRVFCPQRLWSDSATPGPLVWGQQLAWICPHGASPFPYLCHLLVTEETSVWLLVPVTRRRVSL